MQRPGLGELDVRLVSNAEIQKGIQTGNLTQKFPFFDVKR
jgi:hypothetical protein